MDSPFSESVGGTLYMFGVILTSAQSLLITYCEQIKLIVKIQVLGINWTANSDRDDLCPSCHPTDASNGCSPAILSYHSSAHKTWSLTNIQNISQSPGTSVGWYCRNRSGITHFSQLQNGWNSCVWINSCSFCLFASLYINYFKGKELLQNLRNVLFGYLQNISENSHTCRTIILSHVLLYNNSNYIQ